VPRIRWVEISLRPELNTNRKQRRKVATPAAHLNWRSANNEDRGFNNQRRDLSASSVLKAEKSNTVYNRLANLQAIRFVIKHILYVVKTFIQTLH